MREGYSSRIGTTPGCTPDWRRSPPKEAPATPRRRQSQKQSTLSPIVFCVVRIPTSYTLHPLLSRSRVRKVLKRHMVPKWVDGGRAHKLVAVAGIYNGAGGGAYFRQSPNFISSKNNLGLCFKRGVRWDRAPSRLNFQGLQLILACRPPNEALYLKTICWADLQRPLPPSLDFVPYSFILQMEVELPWTWRNNRRRTCAVPWSDTFKYRAHISDLIKVSSHAVTSNGNSSFATTRQAGSHPAIRFSNSRQCAECGKTHKVHGMLIREDLPSSAVAFANTMLGVIVCEEYALDSEL